MSALSRPSFRWLVWMLAALPMAVACAPVVLEPAASAVDGAAQPTATALAAYPPGIDGAAPATPPPYPWPTLSPGPTEPPEPTDAPTETPPPVPTALPTPVVTPIPTAVPPLIPLPDGTVAQPFTLYWRDGDVIRSLRTDEAEAPVFLDPAAEFGLYLPPQEASFRSWGAVSPDDRRFALVLTEVAEPLDDSQVAHPVSIYILDRDGKRPRLLVKNGADPVWSPDGKRVAFRSTETQGLWVADADGGAMAEVYKVDRANGHAVTDFSWSPDGRHLVLVDEVFRQSRDLIRVNVDQLEAPLVLVSSPANWVYMPQWSPTADRITFVWIAGEGAENWHLWTMNSDGTAQRQLTRDIDVLAGGGPPLWSPHGGWIAFGGAVENEAPLSQIDLWLLNPDGTDLRRLTYGRETETNDPQLNETAPQWSPDGTQLVFQRGGSEVMVLSLIDGVTHRLLSRESANHLGLVISR